MTSLAKCIALVGLLHSLGLNTGYSATEDDLWERLDCTGRIAAIAINGKDVFIGGNFTAVEGVPANNVAKWNGTNWASLGEGILGGGPLGAYVFSIAASDRFVYVGGVITNAGGVAVKGIARWDGTNWHSLGGGVDGYVRALALLGENVYAGGSFHSAGGISTSNIARWDGTNWHALDGGVSEWVCGIVECFDAATVRTLAVAQGGLYVGGDFTRVDGVAVSSIAKWDGASWSTVGGGLPGYSEGVHALAILETNVFVGGNIRWVPGLRGPGVARWDGSTWSAIPQSDFEGVDAIAVVGSSVFVAGGVGQAGTNQVNGGVFRWDGTKWSRLGSGVTGGVQALASNGSELWVGGYFTQVGGKPANNLAVWHIPHRLQIQRSATGVVLAWPATGTNLVLEAKDDLGGTNWIQVTENPTVVGDQVMVSHTTSGPTQFYQLRR